MKVGMIAEATCIGKPFTIIPMVVTEVQDVIAAGQMRPTDQLIDVQQIAQPGTLTVFLEPLFRGRAGRRSARQQLHRQRLHQQPRRAGGPEDIGTGAGVFLHVVDAVGCVHAMILRMQALLLPVQTLVLGGH